MREPREVERTGSLQVDEYEFTLFVTTCSVKLVFPCKFCLSWKIGTRELTQIARALRAK